MFWFVGILIVVFIGLGLYVYIRKTPQGFVDFRSGLVIKFLPPLDAMPIIELRDAIERFVEKNAHKIGVVVDSEQELKIPTRHGNLRARIYRGTELVDDKTLCFFHGGGWCICSIDTHREQIKRIALTTRRPVVAVDYSLSPENKFPIALEECTDVLNWLAVHAAKLNLPAQFVPIGDSAGGNLAIAATREILKQNKDVQIAEVVAVYPCTDVRERSTESHLRFEKGYYLTGMAMDAFADAYLRDNSDRVDPRVSLILADDWSDFPKTMILTAEFDPLRDEGEALGERMKAAGVDVVIKRYRGVIHGFFGLKAFGNKGLKAVSDVARFLN